MKYASRAFVEDCWGNGIIQMTLLGKKVDRYFLGQKQKLRLELFILQKGKGVKLCNQRYRYYQPVRSEILNIP